MRRMTAGTARGKGGRRKTARAPLRRKPRALWQTALLRWGGPGALALMLVGGGVWAWSSGWADRQLAALGDATLEASAEAGLALREVLVQGRGRTSQEDLMTALDLKLGAPILSLDPETLRAQLEALPWVARAMKQQILLLPTSRAAISPWRGVRRDFLMCCSRGRGAALPPRG